LTAGGLLHPALGIEESSLQIQTKDSDTVSENRPSLGRTFSIVALLSIISKIIGLVRDIFVAGFYGAGVLSDAYNYAYLFTGNILILFGGLGGPFHSATVTTLTSRRLAQSAGALVTQIVLVTAAVLSVLMVIVFAAAPYLVQVIAGGYSPTDPAAKQQFIHETVTQLQLMSPLVMLSGLIGISYGVLNVYDRVFWPSLSPAIASLCIIGALLLFPNHQTSLPLAAGTLVGALGQLSAQIPQMFRCGLQFQFTSKKQDGLHDYASVLWPALFGTSIGQLIIYVDGFFCAGISDGAWTAVANANRLVQLPLGVLITAMIVPILPRFTEHASKNRTDELKEDFRRALRFLCFLAMPLTVILMAIPEPIVKLLYQRYQWGPAATEMVVSALIFFVPSIIFYIGRDLITRVFYALQDSKTPYRVAILAIFIKAFLDYLLVIVIPMKVSGISLATSIITVFNLSLLAFLLRRKIGPLGITKLIQPFMIMAFAGVAAWLTIDLTQQFLSQTLTSDNMLTQIIKIGIDVSFGTAAYLICCIMLRLEEPRELAKRFLPGS
jgi:putative peptidoglycan lipid II flippase